MKVRRFTEIIGSDILTGMVYMKRLGGMPTVATEIDLVSIAKACGYPQAVSVHSLEAIDT